MRRDPFSVCLILFACFVLPLFSCFSHAIGTAALGGAVVGGRNYRVPVNDGPTVRKDERWPLMSTEFGEISAIKINDGKDGCYHVQFITLEPQSLFLPVHLFSEMVLYVNAGNGTLSWMDADKDDRELQEIKLQKGDIFRLQPRTVFYIQNTLKSVDDPKKLQIYAVFSDSESELQSKQFTKVYAGVQDLVLGFGNKVLQATLNVSVEVIEELRGGEGQTLIVQGQAPEANNSMSEVVSHQFTRAFLGINNDNGFFNFSNKKKDKKKKDKKKDKKKKDKKDKKKTNNIFEADHDVETPNGWSVTLNNKQLDAFQDSDFSVFMVNITKGSMMAPHWNPESAEIAIVLQGEGMVQVICPMVPDETVCKNSRFKVEEGDVFVVPQYHQMAQMSFNNESFVFMGFKMTSEDNPPDQFLTGNTSVLQTLDKTILAKSFHISNMTLMDEVLSAEKESIIIECALCAEDEEKLMEEEEERDGGWREWQKMEAESKLARRQEAELAKRLKEEEEAAAKVKRPVGEIGTHGRQCKCTCMCNV